MRSSLIANQADRYLGKPYSLGNPSQGWDCLNLILDFYRAFGVQFPEEIEGVTEKNYPEKWQNDHDKTKEIFERFLLSIGRPVEKNFFIRGDLLLFKGKELPVSPAIYLGNGNMKMVVPEGVVDFPFYKFERFYIEARRLIG